MLRRAYDKWDQEHIKRWHVDTRHPEKDDEYQVDLALDTRTGEVFVVETLHSCAEQMLQGRLPRVGRFEIDDYVKEWPGYYSGICAIINANASQMKPAPGELFPRLPKSPNPAPLPPPVPAEPDNARRLF